jgi:hypothetical protein
VRIIDEDEQSVRVFRSDYLPTGLLDPATARGGLPSSSALTSRLSLTPRMRAAWGSSSLGGESTDWETTRRSPENLVSQRSGQALGGLERFGGCDVECGLIPPVEEGKASEGEGREPADGDPSGIDLFEQRGERYDLIARLDAGRDAIRSLELLVERDVGRGERSVRRSGASPGCSATPSPIRWGVPPVDDHQLGTPSSGEPRRRSHMPLSRNRRGRGVREVLQGHRSYRADGARSSGPPRRVRPRRRPSDDGIRDLIGQLPGRRRCWQVREPVETGTRPRRA